MEPTLLLKRPFYKTPEGAGTTAVMRSADVFTSVHISKLKVKVKVTLEQAMKAQRGSRGIAPLFL
jgi:hypothetical protein